MYHLERIDEHEMVAVFLKSELLSSRWENVIVELLDLHGASRSIIDHPNIASSLENEYRVKLLGDFRGYKRNRGLFANFPDRVTWTRAALRRDELWKVRYIYHDYWIELSNGTRLPKDAACSVRSGQTVFNVPNDGFLELVEALRNGLKPPELILVSSGEISEMVVLEGHVRITAYAMASDTVPNELPVILGISPKIVEWKFF